MKIVNVDEFKLFGTHSSLALSPSRAAGIISIFTYDFLSLRRLRFTDSPIKTHTSDIQQRFKSSRGYIQHWLKTEKEIPNQSAARILAAATSILKAGIPATGSH
jgi:hypothetical protein